LECVHSKIPITQKKNSANESSSVDGCECKSACGFHQGSNFSWCQLNIEKANCRTALGLGAIGDVSTSAKLAGIFDPTMRNHFLFDDKTGNYTDTKEVWGYCVPRSMQEKAKHALTAHPGCHCADRRDLIEEKYSRKNRPDVWVEASKNLWGGDAEQGKDGISIPTTDENSGYVIDLMKIPWRDRLAVEMMLKRKSESAALSSSGGESGISSGDTNSNSLSKLPLCQPLTALTSNTSSSSLDEEGNSSTDVPPFMATSKYASDLTSGLIPSSEDSIAPFKTPWLVCPVAKECAYSGGANSTTVGNNASQTWFNPGTGKSWDFCSMANYTDPGVLKF
jgi:hypothetical protein